MEMRCERIRKSIYVLVLSFGLVPPEIENNFMCGSVSDRIYLCFTHFSVTYRHIVDSFREKNTTHKKSRQQPWIKTMSPSLCGGWRRHKVSWARA